MRTAQRPSLTINPMAPPPGNPGAHQPLQTPTNAKNPYQTPQGSVSNFALATPGGPATPVSAQPRQTIRPPIGQTPLGGVQRNNSSVSIVSDDDDDDDDEEYQDGIEDTTNSLYSHSSLDNASMMDSSEFLNKQQQRPFTKMFETHIMNTYQNMVSNPQATPFSGRYPPSGIVSKVAKESVRSALAKHILIEVGSKNNAKWMNADAVTRSKLMAHVRVSLLEMCSGLYTHGNSSVLDNQRSSSVSSISALHVPSVDDAFAGLSLSSQSNQTFLTSPQMSPVNHMFSPINMSFNNTLLPEIADNSAATNTASIYDALSSYMVNQSNRNNLQISVGPGNGANMNMGNNPPPLTPITPIAPYANNSRMMSPLYDSSAGLPPIHPQARTLSSPFRDTFEQASLPAMTSSSPKQKSGSKSRRSNLKLQLPETKLVDQAGGLLSPGFPIGGGQDISMLSKKKRDSLKLKRFGGK